MLTARCPTAKTDSTVLVHTVSKYVYLTGVRLELPECPLGLSSLGRKDPLGRMIGGQEVVGVGLPVQRHADQ